MQYAVQWFMQNLVQMQVQKVEQKQFAETVQKHDAERRALPVQNDLQNAVQMLMQNSVQWFVQILVQKGASRRQIDGSMLYFVPTWFIFASVRYKIAPIQNTVQKPCAGSGAEWRVEKGKMAQM